MARNKKTVDENPVIDQYEVQYYPVEFASGTCLERYRFLKRQNGAYSIFLQEGDRTCGFSCERPIPPEMFGGTFEEFMEQYKTVTGARIGSLNEEIMSDGGLRAFLGFVERKAHPEVTMVQLGEMAVIGKQSLCCGNSELPLKESLLDTGRYIVRDLWAEFRKDFSQVEGAALENADGSCKAFWGIMSHEEPVEEWAFTPWGDHYRTGRYLAGVEVNKDASVPSGWSKWLIPARTFVVAEVVQDTYEETYFSYINTVIPEMGLKLHGGICDCIEPATGQMKLFFPVAELV